MGKYQDEVREKLGGEVVDWILEEVGSYAITVENMKDIAYRLGKKIGGNHERRKRRNEPDEAEMRQILEDWWEFGTLSEMTQKEAHNSLIELFSSNDINRKPLVKKIREVVRSRQ